jgi:hypothetical protein
MVAMIGLCAPAFADEEGRSEVTPAMVTAIRERGLVLTDGKDHYIAFQSADPVSEKGALRAVMFYGDGKVFHRMLVKALMVNGRFSWWGMTDERMGLEQDRSKLELKGGTYTVTCRDPAGTTTMTVVPSADARKLLAKATFDRPGMDRSAFALGRDGTTYYYVDRAIGSPENPDYRFYLGKRGAMKLQKVKSLAADDKGTVFTTKAGSLRVTVPGAASMSWTTKKTVTLTSIPIEANLELVFSELGVYAGKKFGVPCDDM